MRNEDDEVVYHCPDCNFDLCEDCLNEYGYIHYHSMERLTYLQLKERYDEYSSGWGCDGRFFRGCENEGKRFKNDFSILYHDADAKFDLCEKCVHTYKITK